MLVSQVAKGNMTDEERHRLIAVVGTVVADKLIRTFDVREVRETEETT